LVGVGSKVFLSVRSRSARMMEEKEAFAGGLGGRARMKMDRAYPFMGPREEFGKKKGKGGRLDGVFGVVQAVEKPLNQRSFNSGDKKRGHRRRGGRGQYAKTSKASWRRGRIIPRVSTGSA